MSTIPRRIALFIFAIPVSLILGVSLLLCSFFDRDTFETGYRVYHKIWQNAIAASKK